MSITEAFTVHPRAKAPEIYTAARTLTEAYKRPSVAKQNAFYYCEKLCKRFNGWNLRITSVNCFTFSVVFDFMHPETGEAMRAVITKSCNHAYYL